MIGIAKNCNLSFIGLVARADNSDGSLPPLCINHRHSIIGIADEKSIDVDLGLCRLALILAQNVEFKVAVARF